MVLSVRFTPKTFRRAIATRHHATNNVSQPVATDKAPRLVALQEKADAIRKLVYLNKCHVVEEELMETLSKVREDINNVVKDPLTHDYCKDKPWAGECKVFDL
jgi:hypothetical protein